MGGPIAVCGIVPIVQGLCGTKVIAAIVFKPDHPIVPGCGGDDIQAAIPIQIASGYGTDIGHPGQGGLEHKVAAVAQVIAVPEYLIGSGFCHQDVQMAIAIHVGNGEVTELGAVSGNVVPGEGGSVLVGKDTLIGKPDQTVGGDGDNVRIAVTVQVAYGQGDGGGAQRVKTGRGIAI